MTQESDCLPRLLLLDTMLGHTGRHSRSQGEQLASLLEDAGHELKSASRRASRAARLADMVWALVRWRRQTDVVSIAVFSGPAFWLADITSRLATALGIPSVVVLHGGALAPYAASNPKRVRRLLNRSDAVVAPSRFNAEALGPFVDESIVVIPNVVDVDLDPDPDRGKPRESSAKRVLWMRALQDLYCPETALQVLMNLRRSGYDVRLTMAGPDKAEMGEGLKQLSVDLGVSESVVFTGFLDAPAKADAFATHDVFLNTSKVDNTPVALLEAAAHGLPIVTTDAGGIPALFEHGRTALICGIGDVEALSSSVRGILDDRPTADSLTDQARQLVRSMTPSRVIPVWQELFGRVLPAHSGRGLRRQ